MKDLETAAGGGHARVLRLRGLPFAATEQDVSQFFGEYTLEEAYLCRRDGRSTGEAYVVFQDAADAEGAMASLNKKYMGSRYIELFEAAEADLAAVKKVLEDTRLQGCVVRLRGLPFTATAADVAAFLSGIPLAEGDDAIVFTFAVDGRPTGEAYVELADKEAQSAAMTRHKELMGSRYIEIFHSSKMDKLQAAQQRACAPDPSYGRFAGFPQRPDPGSSRGAGGLPPGGVDQIAKSLQGVNLLSGGGIQQQLLPVGGGMQLQLPGGSIAGGSGAGFAAAGGDVLSAGGFPRGRGAPPLGAAAGPRAPRGPLAVGGMVVSAEGQHMYYLQQGMVQPSYPLQPIMTPYGLPGAPAGPVDQDSMLQGGGGMLQPGMGQATYPGAPPGGRPMMPPGAGQWMSYAPWPQGGWQGGAMGPDGGMP